jgi:hypothetical protein
VTIIWYIAVLPRWFRIDLTAKRVQRQILKAAATLNKEHQDDFQSQETFG